MGSWYPPDLNLQHELLHKIMPCRAQAEIEGHLPLFFRFVLLGFFFTWKQLLRFRLDSM